MTLKILIGLAIILFFSWYEISSVQICEKKREEIGRDMVIFFVVFAIIYVGVGKFYLSLLDLFKKKIGNLPSYLPIVLSGFLGVATFRTAAELIRIRKEGEEKEDSGLQVVKIGSEMVMIFLGVLSSVILILLMLGIKWWEYKPVIYSTLAGIFVWMAIWFSLPGTYSPNTFKVLAVVFIVAHLTLGVFCVKVSQRGWDPRENSYFEFVERKKREKILAFERERVLRKLPPRKAVIPREILIPRMIYFDQEKRIKVFPKERVKMIFVPNYNWIYERILGYEVLIEGIPYCEVKEEELKGKESVIREFRNKENIPKEIIVRVSRRVLFE